MREFFPLIAVGAVIGALSLVFIIAYLSIKNKKEAIGFERNMEDGEITRRLLKYAKPYTAQFVFVLFLMLFSIAYDILSPLIIGNIEEMIKDNFEMSALLWRVALYGSILDQLGLAAYIGIPLGKVYLHIGYLFYLLLIFGHLVVLLI